MVRKRKTHSKEFKAKVAMEAIKGTHTITELATRYRLHPNQITQWKRQLIQGAGVIFERGQSDCATDVETLTAPLYQEIGRLKMEINFLQKKC